MDVVEEGERKKETTSSRAGKKRQLVAGHGGLFLAKCAQLRDQVD